LSVHQTESVCARFGVKEIRGRERERRLFESEETGRAFLVAGSPDSEDDDKAGQNLSRLDWFLPLRNGDRELRGVMRTGDRKLRVVTKSWSVSEDS